jgi:hypothetical protein
LRSCAKVLELFSKLDGIDIKKISATTVRNWTLKVGLSLLLRQVQKGEYVIIADESIAIGQDKLLLIVGIRVNESSMISPLKMSDVSVLHVESRASWQGVAINEVINSIREKHDITIGYAISDRGNNLMNGFKLSGLDWVEDCTHMIANCSKRFYFRNKDLEDFIAKTNRTRAKWILSKWSAYLPPVLRKKARYHQLFEVYKWAEKVAKIWTTIPIEAQEELIYIKEYGELIAVLKQIYTIIESFSEIFKSRGISKNSRKMWLLQLVQKKNELASKGLHLHKETKIFLSELNRYLSENLEKLNNQSQLICCSDVVESIFGKYKNKNGVSTITEDALTIAAYTEELDMAVIKKAFEEIKIKEIINWKKDKTTESLLMIKKKIFSKMAA